MAKQEIETFMREHKVTVRSQFVPWSQSRNKDEKDPSLNWRVTVERDGRAILETDYMAGMGHCPAYKKTRRTLNMTVYQHEEIAWECEHGFPAFRFESGSGRLTARGKQPILPDPCDVLYSLSMDTSVLDSGTFEEWARDIGYDPDSRNAESIYRQCLEIALKLRKGLGDAGMAALHSASSIADHSGAGLILLHLGVQCRTKEGMTMSKHTPGPWTSLNDETPWTEGDAETAQQHNEPFGPTEILFSVNGADGDRVALCPWLPMAADDEQESLRANARLIAAAPELLKALKHLLLPHYDEFNIVKSQSAGEITGRMANGDLVLKGSFITALEKAQAAIAKAEGRE